MATLPEGTLTFLLTDIEGSTRLWELEPEAMATGMIRHDALFDTAVEQHSGNVVRPRGEGDSRFAVFVHALDAVRAVIAFQQALHAETWPTCSMLLVRAALHTGEADLRQGDYYGSTVNRCARIRALAHGGQTLLSQATANLVSDGLATDTTLEDLGQYELRDLTEPERIFQVNVSGLPDTFPPLASQVTHPTNLPAETTTFVGREAEIEAIRARLLDPMVRLVTLVGPGGTGKTRLALRVARSLLPEFPDGVFFVPLASVQDPLLVVPTIAQTLGLQLSSDDHLESVLNEHLAGKQILLLLDNMDHLLEAAPQLAVFLAACPQLNMLLTSRQTPRLRGNQEVVILPLDAPDPADNPTLEQALRSSAVRLFVERAREVDPAFEITTANAQAIVAICYRLDGLPLAIELAAARIRLFTPQALLTRLERSLALLTGGPVDLPTRQQTLRGTIAWSYDYLENWEQALFRRLAIFRGGFTLESAAAVCQQAGGSGIRSEDDVLDGVASLVSKSLVRRFVSMDEHEEPRFGMLQTIREYGMEQLELHDEVGQTRDQHAQYFAGLAELAEPELSGREQPRWLQILQRDHSNMRAALTWTFESGDVQTCMRLAGALWPFWDLRGHTDEGRRWLERTLTLDAEPALRARVLSGAGTFAWSRGDYGQATRHHQEALEIFNTLNDRAGIAFALNNLGVQAVSQGDYAQARELYNQSLDLYRVLGNDLGIADVINNLGVAAQYQGQLDEAEALYQQSLSLRRKLGDDDRVADALYNLGEISYYMHDYLDAWRLYQESLYLRKLLHTPWGAGLSLAALSAAAVGLGKHERAARLAGSSEMLLDEVGASLDEIEQARFNTACEAVRQAIGVDTTNALRTEGRQMSVDEAIDYGLAALDAQHRVQFPHQSAPELVIDRA